MYAQPRNDMPMREGARGLTVEEWGAGDEGKQAGAQQAVGAPEAGHHSL